MPDTRKASTNSSIFQGREWSVWAGRVRGGIHRERGRALDVKAESNWHRGKA